jgi:hypothetical protein
MQYLKPPASADLGQPITQREFADIIDEAIDQPPWRAQADKEADYVDGNQLDSQLLQRLQALGIPPAKENIIGPAIAAVCGYEAKTRTDWRITPDGDPEGQDVADAMNYRVNQAERLSGADSAMSAAFRPQIAVGMGWVEVARSSDPFGPAHRCRAVHRNEMFWDMRAKEKDLSDAGWLFRERYIKRTRAAAAFPDQAELIRQADTASGIGGYGGYVVEGGVSTGLDASVNQNRAWTSREQSWHRRETDEVCIIELWYRRWVSTTIMRLRGGRVVEFDESNPAHQAAVASQHGKLERTTVARVRRSYWMGPHCLFDGPTPYPHRFFPYVPFWGYVEDMTGVPFGLVRDMLFPQDNLNTTIAKLRWGMASTRTERTKGSVMMTDEQFRRQIGRPDADIILNPDAMAQPGARFEVKRDFQLNAQQFQLMADSRAALERVSPVTPALQGRTGTATSGVQEQTQVEQSQMSIADLMDNFKDGRTMVGELLLALIMEDMGKEEQVVVIEGDTLNPARTVVLNKPEADPATGIPYLSNDVQRTRIKVALQDVPSSSSFRAQQLNALSEAVKAAPPEIQQVVMPFMIDLMDLPRKKEVVEAIRNAKGQANPEALREQIKQELMYELKERELAVKERESEARIQQMVAQAVQTGVQAAFSAMQAGAQVAQMPQIAPVADAIMQGAGYTKPVRSDDPNFPIADVPAPTGNAMPEVNQNTSPGFPPVPDGGASPMTGIETTATTDNLPA